MKKVIIPLLIISSLLFSACNEAASIGIIGGADGPTNIIVNKDEKVETEKWGITLHPQNITPKGLTLKIKQTGGNPTGELHTGSAYSLEKSINGKWQAVETKIDNPVWNSIAYIIKNNDITELDINWEFLYGELSPGYYCMSKEIMDFRKSGVFDEKTYKVYFTIE